MEEFASNLQSKWKHWPYKNTALLILSVILFFTLADTTFVKSVISWIGNFGYIGAFLVGILFVSIFTVAPASVVLFYLAGSLNPFGIAISAGLGGVLGDYLIFKYLKDKVFEEIEPLLMNHGGKPVKKLFQTPYFPGLCPYSELLLSPHRCLMK